MLYRSATLFVVAATLAALTVISPASAQTVRRTSGDGADSMARPYGTSPGQENAPMAGSTRDANGNRVIVNGVYAGSSYTSQDGLTYGVGRNYNTVIVTADQNNSGDQTVVLNGGLKF